MKTYPTSLTGPTYRTTATGGAEDLQGALRQLEEKGARVTALRLELPEELAIQDWAEAGRWLCRADQVMKWWLGDWAAFGLRKYGQLKEFAEANGINYAGLRQLAWVSEKVELSRRRDNVEWSKHQEVAALEAQEQEKWLSAAEKDKLSVSELRRQIRQSHGEHNALESDGPVVRFISKAVDDLVSWLRSRPGEFWTPERREVWRGRLKPIADFYEALR